MAHGKRRLWAWPSQLRQQGVLGINRRNAQYVLPGNPRGHYPRVDDKLLTKQICQARGIPVPDTYAVIARHGDVRRVTELLGDRDDFVIKPASGSEGRGIIVVVGRQADAFITSSGEQIAEADVCYHLSTVLSGLYSLGGQPDRAIIEQRIVRHDVFQQVAVGGTPDIRIVLYRGVPVMAMVRLPTRESRGRANLHQGAVAAGIHLHTGRTFGGVCKDQAVAVHPDTAAAIGGLQVPMWDELLVGAMRLAEGLELGYLGVDFVLDARLGPIVLEANARPGLAIQVANRRGLCGRLQFIDQQSPERLQPEHRRELIDAMADMP
jgi:alpha-L-glutamate ligase-like protein